MGFSKIAPSSKNSRTGRKNSSKKIVQGIDKKETQKRAEAFIKDPVIKARLDRLPAHLRATATTVVRSFVNKLDKVEDSDTRELLDWILRYFESNVLRELMTAIGAAGDSDMTKLAALVQEWGLKQVNSVVTLVQDQIKIIEKLEKVISKNGSLEIEVHKLVEANLWLIREGLELWHSDKPLKRLLDDKIDVIYKGKKNLRPDIVCRSQKDTKQAIILEFKRPSEKIKMTHITQVMEYAGLISAHRPNLEIETFVIGRQYDASVLAVKAQYERANLHLWSLQDILQGARIRFEKILEILGR